MNAQVDFGDADEKKPSRTNTAVKIDQASEAIQKRKEDNKLSDIEQGENEILLVEKKDGGCCSGRSLTTKIVHGVAAGSVVLNIAAIAITGGAGIVIVAAAFAILIAPLVIILQLQLQDTDTMRQLQNLLRRDANRLHVENNKLEAEVDVLQETVGELKEQETRLATITAKQGSSVDEFLNLVKENRALIDKEKEVVRHETAQIVASVVINSDRDNSGKFDEKEISRLMLKLKNLPSIMVNERALMRSLNETGGSRSNILKLISNIIHDDEDTYTSAVFEVGGHKGADEYDGEKKTDSF